MDLRGSVAKIICRCKSPCAGAPTPLIQTRVLCSDAASGHRFWQSLAADPCAACVGRLSAMASGSGGGSKVTSTSLPVTKRSLIELHQSWSTLSLACRKKLRMRSGRRWRAKARSTQAWSPLASVAAHCARHGLYRPPCIVGNDACPPALHESMPASVLSGSSRRDASRSRR
jgi:hypothetical protein